MPKVLINPAKYVQGPSELAKLGSYVTDYGSHALVLITPGGEKRFGAMIAESFAAAGAAACEGNAAADKPCEASAPIYTLLHHQGNCTVRAMEAGTEKARALGCDVIVGIGGGTVLDTAKAVAFNTKKPLIICPTAASTDAPCTGLVVVYSEEDTVADFIQGRNPDLVLMDTEVLAKAPVRLTMSGIGDALSTYFECRQAALTESTNTAGGKPTLTAQAIAKLCYETLLAEGPKAKLALEAGVVTPAVEKIIEANSYMSGIGFESGGLAACHAIHDALTTLPGTHGLYHGEKVAFGVVTQLMMEDASEEELEEIYLFLMEIGLPVTFEELGIADVTEEELMGAAREACPEGGNIHHMPFEVTPQRVFAAMKAADAYGRMMWEMADDE